MKNEGHMYVQVCNVPCNTPSPRRGLTEVLIHSVPNMLDSATFSEYSVPACSPMM